MRKNFSVLIPDGESHLQIYVVNSLSQIKGLKIYVMSDTKYIPIRFSRYIHNFSYYPKTDDPKDWISNINLEIEKYKIDLVMPIFEDGIETLVKYKESIDPRKLCILPSYTDFEKARNKWLLTRHLSNTGIPFPKSFLYSPNTDFEVEQYTFPIIIKPSLSSGGGDGVLFFDNKEALKNYLANNKFESDQIVQEYVKGYDIGCSILCKSGTILAFTIQKATLLNTNPFKPLLGVEFVYDQRLFKTIENLMMSLKWNGVVHIDFKFDEINDTFKVLEINPRFWGSLDASMIAGVNFPYLYCLASLDEYFDVPDYKRVKYLNFKGLAKSIIKKKRLIFKLDFILNHTQVKYAVKDPVPVMLKYLLFSKNILASKFKAIGN